jgi:hypothetical protein
MRQSVPQRSAVGCAALCHADDVPPDDDQDEDEASLTLNPLVVWGAWRASRTGDGPAPPAWVVLSVLLGPGIVLTSVVILIIATR